MKKRVVKKDLIRNNKILFSQRIGSIKSAKNVTYLLIITAFLTMTFISPNTVSALESSDLLFPCDILFPHADSFSDLEGEPPHYKVFENQSNDDNNILVGICYTVSSRGYSDDILIMVGVNNDHTITGMRILEQKEAIVRTIGDFMRASFFYNQYNEKNINDDFKVGRDIDSVTRATITNKYISTAIRDSSRQIDQKYFEDKDSLTFSSEERDSVKNSWDKLKNDGGIVEVVTKDKNGFTGLSMSFAYVNPPLIGKSMLGTTIYYEVMQRYGEEQLFFVGINSNFDHNFGPQNVQIVQGEDTATLQFTRLSYYQSSENGLPVQYYVIAPLEGKIDFSKPDTIGINYVTKSDAVSKEYRIPDKYLISGDPSSLFPLQENQSSIDKELKETRSDFLGFFSADEIVNILLIASSFFICSAMLIRLKNKRPKLVFWNVNYFTIITLSSLATFGILWLDFESALLLVVTSVTATTLADIGITYFRHKKIFFPSSAIIIGLIIGLLLVPETPLYVPVLASLVAVLSKHLIRLKGRQIFNPASFGIMATLLLFPVTLSWWGGTSSIIFVSALGLLVLVRLKKVSHVFSFFLVYASLALANVIITNQDFSFVYI